MIVLPIAAREARAIARRTRSYHLRWAFGLVGLIAILFAFWLGRLTSRTTGETVFSCLAMAAHVYCLFAGVIAAADAISSERREQTLGLLFLTDLKPKDVLVGKIVSSCATSFFGLLAIIPLLGLPFLMGGVSLDRFAWLAASLFNTLFLSIAIGFLASSIFRQGWATLLAGLAFMFVLGAGIPFVNSWFDVLDEFLFVAPGYSLYPAVDSNLSETQATQANESFLFTNALAWASLLIVAVRLVYLWRDRPRNVVQEKRFQFLQKIRFGSRPARKKLRKQLLDQNPLAWLANREQISSFGLLAFWSAFFMIFLLLLMLNAGSRFDAIIFLGFVGLAIAHFTVFFRICVAAAFQMAEERRSGALELLLSTPLSVREIIRGRWLALIRQFAGPILVLSLIHGFLILGFTAQVDQGVLPQFFRSAIEFSLGDDQLFFGFLTLTWIIFALDWFAGAWFGLWLGLRAKTSAGAVWATVFFVLLLPWLSFLAFGILTAILGIFENIENDFDINTGSVFIWLATFLALISAGTLIFLGRRKVTSQFRLAAAGALGPVRLRIPLRLLFRSALVVIAVGIIAAIPILRWRAQVNQRGAQRWREAQTGYPNATQEPSHPPPPSIPASQNLASVEAFHALFAKRTAYAAQNVYGPDRQLDPWTRGDFIKLDALEEIYIKSKTLTNRAATPARSIIGRLAREKALVDELAPELHRALRLQVKTAQNSPYLPMTWNLSILAVARLRDGEATIGEILLMLAIYDALSANLDRDDFSTALHNALQPTFEGLAQHRWNESQLQQLQEAYQRTDVWRAPSMSAQQTIRQILDDLDRYPLNEGDSLFNHFLQRIRPQGWRDESKSEALRTGAEMLIPIFDPKSHAISLPRIIAFESLPETNVAEHYLHQHGNYFISRLHQRAYLQACVNEAIIACALERYRLRGGSFPRTLAELSPSYLSTIPADPITNDPLIYRSIGDNYILYSVAEDGHDNGGIPKKSIAPELKHDWRWSFSKDATLPKEPQSPRPKFISY